MSVGDFGKSLSKTAEKIINQFKKAAEVATKPNVTPEEIEKVWQETENVCKEAGEDALKEARDQAREAATKHLMDRGWWSENDCKKFFDMGWARVYNAAEKVRKNLPKVKKAAHSLWLRIVAAVGALAALAAGTATVATINSGPTPLEQTALDLRRRDELERMQIDRLSEMVINQQEFNFMISRLVPSAPKPTEPPLPIQPLPRAVEAVAAVPVQVILTRPNRTTEFTSTIENVYRSSPEPVQRQIVQIVSAPDPPSEKKEEGYQKPTGTRRHKTWTVGGTPFGSFKFSY